MLDSRPLLSLLAGFCTLGILPAAGAPLPQLVKDVITGSIGSTPRDLTAVDDTLFFTVEIEDGVRQLWKSNGTEAGTQFVKGFNQLHSYIPTSSLTAMNGMLYFKGVDQNNAYRLWRSDGTMDGTLPIGSLQSDAIEFRVAGNAFYFQDYDPEHGYELWKSDGTTAGTSLVKDIAPGIASASPDYIRAIGNIVYFSAIQGDNGYELWRSNGSEADTIQIDVAAEGLSSHPMEFTLMGSHVYFTAEDDSNGRELWKTDGTPEGTSMVKDLRPGFAPSGPKYLTAMGDSLFFVATGGSGPSQYGLWKTDGTSTGTMIVKSLPSALTAESLIAAGPTLFFIVQDVTADIELWASDGTEAGTRLVKDIYPGPEPSGPYNFTAVGNKLYFTASDGIHGNELWVSDGTEAGTHMVADLTGDSADSNPTNLTVIGNKLYFTALTEETGRELFVYDLPLPPYQQWAQDNNLTGTTADNDDGDGLSNFLEYAFGSNPKVLQTASVSETDGTITALGAPAVRLTNPADPQALFVRRKDAASSGMTYTVQFSDDLATWHTSTTAPTVVAGNSEVEIVSVPYPASLPSGNPARFFRVRVSMP